MIFFNVFSSARCCCAAFLLFAGTLLAAPAPPSSTDPVEARVDALLQRLTLEERVSLLAGATSFGTAPIERLGIRGMRFVDGANGVRSNDGDAATAFPVGLALAASWDTQLVGAVGRAIGEEARALGQQVLLAPNLNLVRSPLAGRNFETYGEDPWLVARMGVSFVQGVQSAGVGASAKHFVGNEQEWQRSSSSSNIDERTLHEIYLLPFESVVRDARPWTVMAAYNRLNQVFMSEHPQLVRGLLKDQWAYDGVVMSDWGGTHSWQALNAGLDLEMPGPPQAFGERLLQAVRERQVPVSAVDEAARRVLRLSARTGVLDPAAKTYAEASTSEHRALARRAAASGITLLKNAAELLPLDRTKLRSIAVVGPNADAVVVQGGGSAQVLASAAVSPLDAIRAGGSNLKIRYARGVDNDAHAPGIDMRMLSPTRDRSERGLIASYYANANFADAAVRTRVDQSIGGLILADDVAQQGGGSVSVRWSGFFWPPATGEYEFTIEHMVNTESSTIARPDGRIEARVKLDGRTLIDPEHAAGASDVVTFLPIAARSTKVHLKAGRSYPIVIEYAGSGFNFHSFRMGVRVPAGKLAEAVRAAAKADVAIVFVGSSNITESEGRDRDSLRTFGRQDELVRAVAAANSRTIVVLNNGGPIEMPWLDQVPAIVEAWLPGQEGARAVVDVLFGVANPSGKLPLTFPKRLEDNPSFPYFPGDQEANYGEGLFVGYRHYDKQDIEPLFPFGHGLSYTRFEYRNLQVPAAAVPGQSAEVSVDVSNTGKRSGMETVQLYLSDRQCQDCAVRELKAFGRVELDPGETKTVTLRLEPRAFAYYDSHSHSWQTRAGTYEIAVGSSSRDLRLRKTLALADSPRIESGAIQRGIRR